MAIFSKQSGYVALGIIAAAYLISYIPHTAPSPHNTHNACEIFTQYPRWYISLKKTEQRWQLPIPVALAIIHQESDFTALAETPHRRLLGVPLPWTHTTSAKGYTQAIDSTWQRYQRSTNHYWVDRSSFADAVDFMGWFAHNARRYAGIPSSDAYDLYLAYHEGVRGFIEHSYDSKPWLQSIAWKVQRQSYRYQYQLAHCQQKLPKITWWRYW